MQAFGLTKMQLLKIILLLSVFVLSSVLATVYGEPCTLEGNVPETAISRSDVLSYANFKEDKFSRLNIAALGDVLVDHMPECSLVCLETPPCFSFNIEAFPNVNSKRFCELLPSDMYNNTEKFNHSDTFHHFSITTPCRSWPCQNNGKCLPVYEENDYKCSCEGFRGKNCENDIDECAIVNECHQNATCHNTKGSYNCTCKGGFKGDGRINCTEQVAKGLSNSTIIGDNQTYLVMLSRWLRPVARSNGQWILCWRASLHGWAVATFHSLCDNKGPTVTIVKDTNNNIFGGYTSISWRGENGHKNDPKAFLFSLKNPTNNPRKLPNLDSSSSKSVYDYASYGPTFGEGNDLHIAERANMNSNSYERLGHTYTVPSGNKKDPFLTGSEYFRANEIETFYEVAE